MALEQYVHKGGKKLRVGFTTGSCAALAAKAAAFMLLTGRPLRTAGLVTPAGVPLEAELVDVDIGGGRAGCAVRKDAGDDPDVTDGVLVYAEATKTGGNGITIDGGAGVGRVTLPGLDQPVGAAAINSGPRRMIEEEVGRVRRELGHEGGVAIVISIPGGERLAADTFNPRLGIEGGLSVIGTTGLVEPMSDRAVVDTLAVELNMLRQNGGGDVVVVPGNYGEAFVRERMPAAAGFMARCSNFVGEALDLAVAAGFRRILLVGHAGKLVKVAGGVMDTHSRVADCRLELLALHAALAGMPQERLDAVLAAATVDAGLEELDGEGLRGAVAAGLLRRMDSYLERRVGGKAAVGAVMFSRRLGLLGVSPGGEAMAADWGIVLE